MRPLIPIHEFNWSQANERVRQERAKLDSKDLRDIGGAHDRRWHRAGIVFDSKLALMARLRFYGSLVTISIRIRPTFCRNKNIATKEHFVSVFFFVRTSLAYFGLIHISPFLSSPLYLPRPTRPNPHTLRGGTYYVLPFLFSK